MITSKQNEKLKHLISLKEKKNRDLFDQFIVEGEHLINEAKLSSNLLEVFTTDENLSLDNIPITVISEELMQKISNQVSISKYIGLCQKIKPREIIGNVLILDQIQDPGNLGSIIRSSVAFNIDSIIISPDSVDLYNDKVIRSTQGLIFKINIISKPLLEVITELKNEGYQIIGSVVNGNNININANNKYALIMGNEGNGINKEIIDLCDKLVTVFINPDCESLNVGVATGIILYELNKVVK